YMHGKMLTLYTFLSNDFMNLFRSSVDYDVIIEVGEVPYNKSYKVHSLILQSRSKKLKRDLSEIRYNNDNIKVLKMPHIPAVVFDVIISYIYSGVIPVETIDPSVIFDLLIASDEFCLDGLIEQIQNYLTNNCTHWLILHFGQVYYEVFPPEEPISSVILPPRMQMSTPQESTQVPTQPAQMSTNLMQTQTQSVQMSTNLMQTQAQSVQMSTNLMQTQAQSVQIPTLPVIKSQITQMPTQPTQSQILQPETQIMQAPTQPMQTPTQPMQTPTQPMQTPTQPMQRLTEQVDAIKLDSSPQVMQPQQLSDVIERVVAMWDYTGEDDENDLSFKKGDIIEVTEYLSEGWGNGRIEGKNEEGVFPLNYTKKLHTESSQSISVPMPNPPFVPKIPRQPGY
ncbi:7233_t:CDS:2, partial [Acaulospora morrowiae]